VTDVSLFELAPLIGAGASGRQLRRAAAALRGGYVLERQDADRWVVVGWTGTLVRAAAWVEFRAEPEQIPPPK
jgi:hypothetical protein